MGSRGHTFLSLSLLANVLYRCQEIRIVGNFLDLKASSRKSLDF